MWVWLIPAILVLSNLASCSIEFIGNGFEDDPPSGEATIYVIPDRFKSTLGDIEELFNPESDLYDNNDLEEDSYINPARIHKRGHIRFGRNEKKIHIRYGRDINDKNKTIIYGRLGRNEMLARGKRSTDEEAMDQRDNYKPTIDRQVRDRNHRRYGRNFPNDDESLEKYRLMSLLKQYAGRENNEHGYNGYIKNKMYSWPIQAGRNIRTKRSAYDEFEDQANRNENSNMDRESRTSTYIRFGRNFDIDNKPVEENSLGHSIPPILLPYFKKLAERMIVETNSLKQQDNDDGRSTIITRRLGRSFDNDEDESGVENSGHSIPPILLPVLKQYAARLYSENRYGGYPSSA